LVRHLPAAWLGNLDDHDNLCRRIWRDTGIHVLSVDYRLALGAPVALKCFAALLHGFCSMATISPACEAAVGEIIAALQQPDQFAGGNK
jgi:acetyl esterase/lipase